MAAKAHLAERRTEWTRQWNPTKMRVSWHAYNEQDIDGLKRVQQELKQARPLPDDVSPEALSAEVEAELLYIARTELCGQRGDYGQSVFVDYRISAAAYAALSADGDASDEAKRNQARIQRYYRTEAELDKWGPNPNDPHYGEHPYHAARDALVKEGRRLWPLIRDRVLAKGGAS